MDDVKKSARRAGWLYLLAGLPAPFAYLYVPGRLIVKGDASASAERVRASGMLLRLAIAGELWNAVLVVFAVLALYRLFKDVSERLSLLMAVLFLVSVPLSIINPLTHVAALLLVNGAADLAAFDVRQLDALAYLCLRLHGHGLVLAQIFWGLWLFPLGLVVMRSGFVPRALGALVMVAGAGYVAASFSTVVVPAIAPRVTPLGMALGAGELPLILWLVVFGAKARPAAAPVVPHPPRS